MSRLVQSADQLSNDQLLGITDDYTTRPPLTSNADTEESEQPLLLPKAPRRKLHTLTDELLLSRRGLPTLLTNLEKFKFIRDQSKYDKHRRRHYQSTYSTSNSYRQKYSQSYQFANLTNLLYVYQKFGHDIYPKSKFKDFIPYLSSSVNGKVQSKRFLHEAVLSDIRKKRNGGSDPMDDIMADNNENENGNDNSTKENGNSNDKNDKADKTNNELIADINNAPAHFFSDDDEIYTVSGTNKKSAVINEDEDEDDDLSLMKEAEALIERQANRSNANITPAKVNVETPAPETQTQTQTQTQSTQRPLFFSKDDEDELDDFPEDDNIEDEFDQIIKEQSTHNNTINTHNEDDFDEEMSIMREMDM